MKNTTSGFTLIELLIVIGIIAILAAAIIVAIAPGEQLDRARDATVRSHMQAIATSVYSYVVDNAENPTELADLDISEPSHPLGGGYSFKFNDGRVTVKETETDGECIEYGTETDCLAISY